jgi:hypothetical protein
MTEIVGQLNSGHFSTTTCFVTRCLCCKKRAPVEKSGVIRAQTGKRNIPENDDSAWDAL